MGRVAAHDLVEDTECVDELYLNGSPSGGFSLASALKIISNEEELSFEEVRGWRTMWRVDVPQRVRFSLWLASHDRVMTNSNRFLRNLTDDPRCLVCGEVEENTAHILRDCPTAIMVWGKLGVELRNVSWRLPLKDWLLINLESVKDEKDGNWGQLFSITVWWLWRWRNERVFSSASSIPIDQVSFILARVHQVRKAFNRKLPEPRNQMNRRTEVLVRWKYPSMGWVRLNTDGASKGNPGRAGAGGVIRGHRGELFEVFALNCGVCSCTRAELLV